MALTCWIWTGRTTRDGYGVTGKTGRRVHRLVYEQHVGPIPAGHALHHTCGVRRCINPAHLEPIRPGVHSRLHHPRRTHCPRGHSMADAILTRTGTRKCRVCHNAAKLKWFHAHAKK